MVASTPTMGETIVERYKKLEQVIKKAVNNGETLTDLAAKFPAPMAIQGGMVGGEGCDEMSNHIRQGAKQMVWERMSSQLMSQEEVMTFYNVLEKWADRVPQGMNPKWFRRVEKNLRERGLLGSKNPKEKYIDVHSFLKAREEMDPRIREMLGMTHYMTFLRDSDDKVFQRLPIIHLFNYVMKKVWLKQTRLGFMNYDLHGSGYLTEEWLESYIKELIPTLKQLEGLDPEVETFYLCASTRKFFFFLDPNRIGKVRIVDILASMTLDEILELRDLEVISHGWFSKPSMLRVYEHYLQLDKNVNGMLSREEFMKFNYSSNGSSVRLTSAFVHQLFLEKMTFKEEMDFRSYVDFVLAMEHRKEEQSIEYFVRAMDLDKKGYLNSFDLQYFYKAVYEVLTPFNPETPKFDDVKDEIFDMIKPQNPLKITVKDLFKCGKGDLIISMLIDAKGFDDYENREFVMISPQTTSTLGASSKP